MTRLAAAAPLLLAASLAGEARAQWRGAVEVGGAVLQQELADAGGAVTLGASLARQGRLLGLAGDGLLAGAPDGRGYAHGRLRLDRTGAWDAAGRRAWSLAAEADAWRGGGGERAESGYVSLRQSLALGRGGLWGSFAVGGVRERGDDFGARVAELGAWRGAGTVAVSAGATVVDTRAAYNVATPGGNARFTEPATYADPAVALRWRPRATGGHALAELQLRAGARYVARGGEPGTGTRWFGGADLAVPVGGRVELSVAAGRQLADLVHGVPAARWASVGLRVPLYRRGPRTAAPATRPTARLEHDAEGARLVIELPRAASRVEVVGTATDWEPVALEGTGTRWRTPRPLPPGTHRLLVRLDGGAWFVPSGLTAVRDEEGGEVGVLVVP